MRSFNPLSSILLSIFIVACSPAENHTPKVDNIAAGARSTLDKARTIDDTLEQSASKARQNIDEQSQ